MRHVASLKTIVPTAVIGGFLVLVACETGADARPPGDSGNLDSSVGLGKPVNEPLAGFARERRESLEALFAAVPPERNPHSRMVVDAYLSGKEPPYPRDAPSMFLGAVDRADRTAEGLAGGRRYFTNDITVETFVTGLSSRDTVTKETALQALLKHARPEQLGRHSARLFAAWEEWGSNAIGFDRLIVLADPETPLEVIRKGLPEALPTPLELSARLGNKEAADHLIASFLESSDPKTKARLASDLGFVGTRDAAIALAQEMRSPLVIEDANVRSSIRITIIEALGYIYPDVDLLNDGLARMFYHVRYPPPLYGDLPARNTPAGREALVAKIKSLSPSELARIIAARTEIPEQYIAAVEEWCTNELGVTWSSKRPSTSLREDRPRIHPPRRR